MSDEPMDQANRFGIVVTALVVVFLALLVVLLAWGASSDSIGRIEDFAGWLRKHDDGETKTVITLGASVIVLLMLSVIILEVTPSPTQRLRVRNVKAGGATITTKEIAARINAEIEQHVADVSDCQAIVATHGKGVDVVLELHVEPGADLAHTANVACGRAHALVEQQVGVELASPPRARLHYRELRLREEKVPTGWERPPAEPTGWERPPAKATEERDERGQPDTPEEAQA
jgi:hypothetical protein